MEMKVMTMKIPAIRAILLDGGSPGPSSGARSAWSGCAGSVTAAPSSRRRGPLRVDVPKAGQERDREGHIATVGTTVRRSIHSEEQAQTDSRRNPIAPERPHAWSRAIAE